MPWRPTNCAVQRSFRGESTGEVVKVTPERPGGIFRRRCIVPIKTADGIDQTEWCKGAASCVDRWRFHDRSFCVQMKPSNVRTRGCDTALTQSDRLMPKQETLLKLFIKSYLSWSDHGTTQTRVRAPASLCGATRWYSGAAADAASRYPDFPGNADHWVFGRQSHSIKFAPGI